MPSNDQNEQYEKSVADYNKQVHEYNVYLEEQVIRNRLEKEQDERDAEEKRRREQEEQRHKEREDIWWNDIRNEKPVGGSGWLSATLSQNCSLNVPAHGTGRR